MHNLMKMAQEWHQETPSQRYASLNGEESKFLRNTCFSKKNEMQASNAKVMGAHAEAIKALVKPKKVKPKLPKVPRPHKGSRVEASDSMRTEGLL